MQRPAVDKAMVENALTEILEEIPAFRVFAAGRRHPVEGQVQRLTSTLTNATTTTTSTVAQAGGGKSITMGINSHSQYSPC